MGILCCKSSKAEAYNEPPVILVVTSQTTSSPTSLQHEPKDVKNTRENGRPAPSMETPSSTPTPKSQESIKKPTRQSPPSSTPRDNGTITEKTSKENVYETPYTWIYPSSTTEDKGTITPIPKIPGDIKPSPRSNPTNNGRKVIPDPSTSHDGQRPDLSTVGIFSRSSNTDYSWMEKLLRSDLSPPVSTVRTFIISNNQTREFYEELKLCKFGILYHTKNRGIVNVTNTDSLYDEELEAMNKLLGRDHVLVVIDDLQDSSTEEKDRILTSQPSIKKYSRNLLLVTEQEKKDEKILLKRLREAL